MTGPTSVARSEKTYATYTLTPNGQVDTVTDANGNVTNLDYDGMDRPYRTFLPAPATGTPCAPALPHSTSAPSCASGQTYEELTYDPAGNVTAKRNRSGLSITYAFDDLDWAAAGFTDTWFRCDDETRGGKWQRGSSAESSSLRR